MKRGKDCENCSKFSHCNNNDLFCEKFLNSKLQTAKEEIKEIKSELHMDEIDFDTVQQLKHYCTQAYRILTQQNKQMIKALKYIKSITDFEQVKDLPEQRGRCIYQFKLVNSECAEALTKLGGE